MDPSFSFLETPIDKKTRVYSIEYYISIFFFHSISGRNTPHPPQNTHPVFNVFLDDPKTLEMPFNIVGRKTQKQKNGIHLS